MQLTGSKTNPTTFAWLASSHNLQPTNPEVIPCLASRDAHLLTQGHVIDRSLGTLHDRQVVAR
jgi:hypothetical protein